MNDNTRIKIIKTQSDLSNFFGIPNAKLKKIKNDQDSFQREIHLMKKNGGLRVVYDIWYPAKKEFVKKINDFLQRNHSFSEHVQGFVKNKNIKTNAEKHLGKKIIINADIENFFESVNIDDVFQIFHALKFNEEHSYFLAETVTLNDKLVQGFSTSPILANIFMKEVDIDFLKLAQDKGYVYTRYADDLTFSTNGIVPLSFEEIESILNKKKLSLNTKKNKIQKKGGNQYVTGLTVCDLKQPRLPRYIKKNLRLELYYVKKFGLESHCKRTGNQQMTSLKFICKIEGWAAYAESIEPDFARFLMNELGEIV
ncbi:MAG: reverse transcriptase family protein [Candidatus Moraniibacteriota bacterium]|jgi:RNA-directed DNA polymerase